MTRINLVPPTELMDQHLFAEWREIKMVPAALRRSLRTKDVAAILKSIPSGFTLNAGHVTFFYNKLIFLSTRYRQLTEELLFREYKISSDGNFAQFIEDLPLEFCELEWHPSPEEIQISANRISEKIALKPHWYKYLGEALK